MKLILLFLICFLVANTYSQLTLIPDPNFEQKLIDLGYDTGVPDGSVPTANISTITSLELYTSNIEDLTGIEDFTSLTFLGCNSNFLTSLNVTNNTALTYLDCSSNFISSIDLSQNIALEMLFIVNNPQLTELDVSHNVALDVFDCSYNSLSYIDLSTNTSLRAFYAFYNFITELDVSNNPLLESFYCSHNNLTCLNLKNGNNSGIVSYGSEGNSDLTCIDVDDLNWANNNWTQKDAHTSFSLNCGVDCALNLTEDINISSKKLIKILDLTGRETQHQKNMLMIYIYEDGTSQKVIEME